MYYQNIYILLFYTGIQADCRPRVTRLPYRQHYTARVAREGSIVLPQGHSADSSKTLPSRYKIRKIIAFAAYSAGNIDEKGLIDYKMNKRTSRRASSKVFLS